MTAAPDDPAERLRRIGAATAGVAHDLNNILAGIDAIAATAVARAGLDPETAAELAEIRAAVARGAGLVRALLTTGARPPRPARPRPLDPELAGAASMIRRLLPPEIRFAVRLAAPGRRVRIDPDRLHAALLNLAINARHAMAAGGALQLSSAERILRAPLPTLPPPGPADHLPPDAVPPGRYAVVSLRDTGPGLAPELAAKLFTPFVSTRAGGTGLGLISVRDSLRAAGGYLVLGPRPGEGSGLVARMFLPLADAPVPDPAAIWLVEDEPGLRTLFARALRDAGWQVTALDSAEMALALHGPGTARPALLVCDVGLPGMDGPALVHALRRRWRGLPAVLMSGYDDTATPAGCAFLRKPFALAELVAEVGRLAGEVRS